MSVTNTLLTNDYGSTIIAATAKIISRPVDTKKFPTPAYYCAFSCLQYQMEIELARDIIAELSRGGQFSAELLNRADDWQKRNAD